MCSEGPGVLPGGESGPLVHLSSCGLGPPAFYRSQRLPVYQPPAAKGDYGAGDQAGFSSMAGLSVSRVTLDPSVFMP